MCLKIVLRTRAKDKAPKYDDETLYASALADTRVDDAIYLRNIEENIDSASGMRSLMKVLDISDC
tara:strand:+ start:1543 stop:1737 length:195 start_codon:yes stop_codon:yes gene_type:complete